MQAAVPEGVGAMAAILGLDLAAVEAVVTESADGEVCAVANDNAPGQVVVSGHRAAVERAVEHAKAKGAKRAVFLQVSAPFHCSLMKPAAETMHEALAATSMLAPTVPLIANVTAEKTSDAPTIRGLLVLQVTDRVRWTETVQYMKTQGVERIIEIGEGSVLSGLVKRIDREIETFSVGTPEEVEGLLKGA